jgi:hypothetical protein
MTMLDSLQAALAAEQAVVYGYGVVGAHLATTAEAYASDRLTEHMLRRDKLTALITAVGGTPGTARVAYQLPFEVTDAKTGALLGAHLEQGANGAYWDLIAAASPSSSTRSLAIDWLSNSAVSANRWGAPQALPGQPA